MSGKQKRKPIAESSGGLEDWLMPDYTRSVIELGVAAVLGMATLLILNNPIIASMVGVFVASPAIVTPVVRHVLKKVEAQIAQIDQEIGVWADTTDSSIKEFQLKQREQMTNLRDHVANVETRVLGVVSRLVDKDPTIKVDIEAVINDIHSLRRSLDDQTPPTISGPDQGNQGKGSPGLSGPG